MLSLVVVQLWQVTEGMMIRNAEIYLKVFIFTYNVYACNILMSYPSPFDPNRFIYYRLNYGELDSKICFVSFLRIIINLLFTPPQGSKIKKRVKNLIKTRQKFRRSQLKKFLFKVFILTYINHILVYYKKKKPHPERFSE